MAILGLVTLLFLAAAPAAAHYRPARTEGATVDAWLTTLGFE